MRRGEKVSLGNMSGTCALYSITYLNYFHEDNRVQDAFGDVNVGESIFGEEHIDDGLGHTSLWRLGRTRHFPQEWRMVSALL